MIALRIAFRATITPVQPLSRRQNAAAGQCPLMGPHCCASSSPAPDRVRRLLPPSIARPVRLRLESESAGLI
jgi:hypothetical protein